MIDLIIFCFGTASLSHFFQVAQEEGMIFEWYGKLLDKIPEFFAMPLGRCITCNGTWIFIIAFFLTIIIFNNKIVLFSLSQPEEKFSQPQSLIALFLGIGINFIWIKVIDKYILE